MFFRDRYRRYYERFSSFDPVTQVIALAALLILLVIALPGIWGRLPGAASGVSCQSLASPKISGNNQSLLSVQQPPDVLHLELAPPDVVISQGQPLVLELRFINEGMAPVTLFLPPDEFVFRYTEQEAGILFSIQTADGRAIGEPPNVRPPFPIRQQFPQNQLHVLGPRQRCNVRIELDPARLNSAQLVTGQYRITAVYRNQYRGTVPPVGPQTPTPIFKDQGVWIGPQQSNWQVQSNEIRVSVGLPTQPPPGQ
jgi:hypothetical protein